MMPRALLRMEFIDLLQESKWKIIRAINNGFESPSEISKETGMSLPHITQNVAVLEASGILKKKKETRKELGKPKNILSINKEIGFFATMGKKSSFKKTFVPNEFHKQTTKIMLNTKEEDHFYLIKFLLKEEIVDKAQAIAYIESTDKEIHLLIITEYLEYIRNNFSNLVIKNFFEGGQKKIVCWSHNVKEIKEGLVNKESYFENLMKKPIPLIDKIAFFD